MEIIHYSITIEAPVGSVWNTMLDPVTYGVWTKPFSPSSYYEGGWEEGSEIRFLMTREDGSTGGMYSRIKKRIDHQFISIEHLGTIENGIIDTASEAVKKWAPSFENYTLQANWHQTKLIVDMETDAEYKPVLEKMWPQALQLLKGLCEE